MTIARKHDADKPMMELLDPAWLVDVARAMTYGARKYAIDNWRHGLDSGRLYGAMQRHLTAWHAGENIDPESGLSHLAHASACVMMIHWTVAELPERDTRWAKREAA